VASAPFTASCKLTPTLPAFCVRSKSTASLSARSFIDPPPPAPRITQDLFPPPFCSAPSNFLSQVCGRPPSRMSLFPLMTAFGPFVNPRTQASQFFSACPDLPPGELRLTFLFSQVFAPHLVNAKGSTLSHTILTKTISP